MSNLNDQKNTTECLSDSEYNKTGLDFNSYLAYHKDDQECSKSSQILDTEEQPGLAEVEVKDSGVLTELNLDNIKQDQNNRRSETYNNENTDKNNSCNDEFVRIMKMDKANKTNEIISNIKNSYATKNPSRKNNKQILTKNKDNG